MGTCASGTSQRRVGVVEASNTGDNDNSGVTVAHSPRVVRPTVDTRRAEIQSAGKTTAVDNTTPAFRLPANFVGSADSMTSQSVRRSSEANRGSGSSGGSAPHTPPDPHQGLHVDISPDHDVFNDSSTRNRASPAATPVDQKINWKRGEMIGKGAAGTVYLALDLDTQQLMAAKEVNGARLTPTRLRMLAREVRLLKSLVHKNIVRYIGTATEGQNIIIFTEWVPGGSLSDVLKRFGKLPPSVVRTYAQQMLLGVQHLHKNNVIHRDIKPANLLIDSDGVVKLSDFGESERLQTLSDGSMRMSNKVLGTPYYMSPEVIRRDPGTTGREADVWAVGCTVLHLLTGRPPWRDTGITDAPALLMHIACSDTGPTIPDEVTGYARQFVEACFTPEFTDRPAADDLLEHPFLTTMDDMDLGLHGSDSGDSFFGDGDICSGSETEDSFVGENVKVLDPSGTMSFANFHVQTITPQQNNHSSTATGAPPTHPTVPQHQQQQQRQRQRQQQQQQQQPTQRRPDLQLQPGPDRQRSPADAIADLPEHFSPTSDWKASSRSRRHRRRRGSSGQSGRHRGSSGQSGRHRGEHAPDVGVVVRERLRKNQLAAQRLFASNRSTLPTSLPPL